MIEANQPAHPLMPSHKSPGDLEIRFRGLTKLEYFAAMAMNGMLANSYSNGAAMPLSEASRREIAELAVDQAKALLARLREVT